MRQYDKADSPGAVGKTKYSRFAQSREHGNAYIAYLPCIFFKPAS